MYNKGRFSFFKNNNNVTPVIIAPNNSQGSNKVTCSINAQNKELGSFEFSTDLDYGEVDDVRLKPPLIITKQPEDAEVNVGDYLPITCEVQTDLLDYDVEAYVQVLYTKEMDSEQTWKPFARCAVEYDENTGIDLLSLDNTSQPISEAIVYNGAKFKFVITDMFEQTVESDIVTLTVIE
jgi:hypothetical protein